MAQGLEAFTNGDGAVNARTVPGGAGEGWPLTVEAGERVADGLGGDVLTAKGGVLRAPADRGPALAHTVELAHGLGIDVEESEPTLEALAAADEIVIVGMPFCVLPVAALDGRELGAGPIGPGLARAWADPPAR